jgi:hypothetical protein
MSAVTTRVGWSMTPQEFGTSFVEQPADILNRDYPQLLKPTHAKAGYGILSAQFRRV